MATWNIRSQNDRLRLPDHYFPLTRNSIEGHGERVPLLLRHFSDQCNSFRGYLGLVSTCSHPRIVSWLHIQLQAVKAYSILDNSGFFRTDVHVASTHAALYLSPEHS